MTYFHLKGLTKFHFKKQLYCIEGIERMSAPQVFYKILGAQQRSSLTHEAWKARLEAEAEEFDKEGEP